jgi:hypothetical protein
MFNKITRKTMSKKGGRGARKRRREKRLIERRARKAANEARYAEWRRLGINGKSKRFKSKRKKHHHTEDHPNGNCGNVGCKKCFPALYQLGIEYREKCENDYLSHQIIC